MLPARVALQRCKLLARSVRALHALRCHRNQLTVRDAQLLMRVPLAL